MAGADSEGLPAVGTPIVDTTKSVIGKFQYEYAGRYYLRPQGGGREWDVHSKWCRVATDEDLSSEVLTSRRIRWRDEDRKPS